MKFTNALMHRPDPVQAEANYTPGVINQYGGFAPEKTYDLYDEQQGDAPGTAAQGFAQAYAGGLPSQLMGDPQQGPVSTGVPIQQGTLSFGSYSWAQRFAPFTGIVTSPPSQAYTPRSGNVGTDVHQQYLFAGVTNQLANYVPSQSAFAAAYLGPISYPTYAVGEGTQL